MYVCMLCRVTDKTAINQVLDLLDTWFTECGTNATPSSAYSALSALNSSDLLQFSNFLMCANVIVTCSHTGAKSAAAAQRASSTLASSRPITRSRSSGVGAALLSLHGDASTLPHGFCYGDLFHALDVLLSSEHFQVLLKTLWFVVRDPYVVEYCIVDFTVIDRPAWSVIVMV